MKKDKNHLIGKNILVIITFLFCVVLILTFLTLLSNNEIPFDQFNDLSANESTKRSRNDDLQNLQPDDKVPIRKDQNPNKNLREDQNIKEFLDILNGLLVDETESKNSSNFLKELELNQDWQNNSLNITNAFAQKLNRVATEEEEDYDTSGKTNYQRAYQNSESKNYQPKETNYSDEDYDDKLNTVIVYDKTKYYNDPDSNDEVKYYLIRKEHNRINLASQNEVKGLNELIHNALVNQEHSSAKYNPMHINIQAPNLYQPSPNLLQPSNIIPQYPSNFAGPPRDHYPPPPPPHHWGWNSWNNFAKREMPYSQLTLKQRVKVNLCEKMLKKVKIKKPKTVVLPVYTGNGDEE